MCVSGSREGNGAPMITDPSLMQFGLWYNDAELYQSDRR